MDQFHDLFVKLDQNNDGFISVAELHDEMRKHGILSADGRVQVTFIFFNMHVLEPDTFIHSKSGHLKPAH